MNNRDQKATPGPTCWTGSSTGGWGSSTGGWHPGVSKPRSTLWSKRHHDSYFPSGQAPDSALHPSLSVLISSSSQCPIIQLASGIKRGQSRAFWASDSFQNQRGVSFLAQPTDRFTQSESTQDTEGPGQSKAQVPYTGTLLCARVLSSGRRRIQRPQEENKEVCTAVHIALGQLQRGTQFPP